MACSADNRFVRKHVDAVDTYGFDFGPQLADGDTLTGTPTASVDPAGLVTSGEQVNGAVFTDSDGSTIPVGEGVLVQISGGTVDVRYELTIECESSTGATKAETFVVYVFEDCC